MFALERRFKHQKEIAQDAVRQGFVITKENHKLVNKVIKQKNEIKQYAQKEKLEREKERKIRKLKLNWKNIKKYMKLIVYLYLYVTYIFYLWINKY